ELVVARLRVRGVDHAEATVELVRLRAEVGNPGADQERGQHEARALAARVAERAVHVRAGRRARRVSCPPAVVAPALDVGTLVDRPALDAHGVLTRGGTACGHGEGRGGRRRRLRHTPRVDPGRLRAQARARRPAAEGVVGAALDVVVVAAALDVVVVGAALDVVVVAAALDVVVVAAALLVVVVGAALDVVVVGAALLVVVVGAALDVVVVGAALDVVVVGAALDVVVVAAALDVVVVAAALDVVVVGR